MNKILAIDDQKGNLHAIEAIFNDLMPDCKIFTAQSGKEGIEIARQEQPDTILLDVVMPEMDGYEVCKILKANEKTQSIPIIMVSAFQINTNNRVKGLKSGADVFLSKPIDKDELLAQVSSMLRIRKAEKTIKESEEIVKESGERYRCLSEAAFEAIFFSEKGICLEQNSAAEKMFGYSLQEAVGRYGTEWIIPEDRKIVMDNILSGYEGPYEVTALRKDGTTFPCEIQARMMQYKGKTVRVTALKDITERKKAEETLLKSEVELRAYTVYFDTKVEEEKKIIAAEIHDGLGQLLTILKMDLLWLKKKIPEKNIQINEKFDSMKNMIDSGVQMVQDISMRLRPGMLDDLGLIATIQWELNEFQERTGIKCKGFFEPDDFTVDFNRSTTLFRILMEILTNVYRHSGASQVDVSLIKKQDELILRVQDNGKGITKEEITSSFSFGIIGIKERANIWKGKVKFTGIQGKGTIVTTRIPV